MRGYIFLHFIFTFLTHSNGSGKRSVSPKLSTLEDCRRTCTDNEPPRYCYYHFRIEYYVTMGSACTLCRQNNTDQLLNVPNCQCVEADGVDRTILSINRLLPGPSIQVCQHDMIIVDLENKAEGLEVILHWHGLFQKGYQYFDGVPMVTQCKIPAGDTFRYQFAADNAGTFFYHSHVLTQKMDGQFGSLIVRQTSSTDPNWSEYDEDLPTHIILVNDWLHHLSTELFPGHYTIPGQVPDNLLINGKGLWKTKDQSWNFTSTQLETFYVKPEKRYRFRFINAFSNTCPAMFTIQNHNIAVIAQDGISVQPDSVTSLHTASGERVDFVLTANQKPGSYWIQVRGLRECAETKVQQLAILTYLGAPEKPYLQAPTYDKALPEGRVYNPPDGQCNNVRSNGICVQQFNSRESVDSRLTRGEPDKRVILPFGIHFYNRELKKNFAPNTYNTFLHSTGQSVVATFIDNIIYATSKSPLISQNPGPKDTCNRNRNTENCDGPCHCTHVIDIKKGSVVEVVLYDQSPNSFLSHPFHLHGYAFTVLKIGPADTSENITNVDKVVKEHQKTVLSKGYNKQSPKKDTILVPSGGYIIFRFIADNPGWWFFHCHIDWHSSTGMKMVVHVGEPKDLPPIPSNFPTCGDWKPPPQLLV